METIKCPYCECKVRMADVDANDGMCPECGAPVVGSLLSNGDTSAADDSEFDATEEETLDFQDEDEDDDVDLDGKNQ